MNERLAAALQPCQELVRSARERALSRPDTAALVADILRRLFGYAQYEEITADHKTSSEEINFALRVDRRPVAFVAVVAVQEKLKDRVSDAAVQAAATNDVPWIILTNGAEWRILRVLSREPSKAASVSDFSLLDLVPGSSDSIDKLKILCREGWQKVALDAAFDSSVDAARNREREIESLLIPADVVTRKSPISASAAWYIGVGLLFVIALACFFWQSLSIVKTPVNVLIGVAVLAIGIVVLVIRSMLHGTPQTNGSIPGQSAARETACAQLIRDATQRVEAATAAVKAAQEQVDTAAVAVGNAPPRGKAAADAALATAKENLVAVQDKLQSEQSRLESLTRGPQHGFLAGSLQFLVFGVLALVVLIFLMYGIVGNQVLLPSLSTISVSRGLITFLIAMVTVTIALILVLATVVADSDDRSQRFTQGKEILTMLIGVLGTIVGFYFGNTEDGVKPLQIATPVVSNETPAVGTEIALTSFISGGKAPFGFSITFSQDIADAIPEGHSPDGVVRLSGLKITKAPSSDAKVSYQIKARDSEGRTGIYDSAAAGRSLEVRLKQEPAKQTQTTPK